MIATMGLMGMLASPALAEDRRTEVAFERSFGLGAHLGVPTALTGKWWLDEKGGIAFHAGFFFGNYFEGRVQFEHRFLEFADWPWADFGMYWAAGVSTRSWFRPLYRDSFQIGPHGGIGVTARFKDYPFEVFAEADVQAYVVTFLDGPLVGFVIGPGARYYF